MPHYLSVLDLDPEQSRALLDDAAALKRARAQGDLSNELYGKHVALYFEKPSVRTRTSFTVGAHELGAHVVELGGHNTKVGKGEHVEDFAKVVARYAHGIVARVFHQATLEGMAAYAGIPVINALSDARHPCQALADVLTIIERFGAIEGRKIAFVGEGNNVAVSLGQLGAALGAHVVVASPEGYGVPQSMLRQVDGFAGSFTQVHEIGEAIDGADVVYTDTWISMGQEAEAAERRKIFTGYTVDDALLDRAADGVIAMHCLPAVRGEEITVEVMHGARSAMWDQAENRLHVQKALMRRLLQA